MTRPAKQRVRQSFERAATTYDSAATIQRGICDELAGRLPAGLQADCVLDAGCGTGYALDFLRRRFPGAVLFALDISPAMLRQAAGSCLRLAGDIEHMPLRDASIDFYWSSLTVQWCNLPGVLGEARRVLAGGGRLAIASLGPATFHELRHAFAGVDDYRHTLPFHDADEVGQMARRAGFADAGVRCGHHTAHYADFRAMLQAVKAIGANQVGSGRRGGLMSRSAFARAEAACEELRTPLGLPLTYDVITLEASG